MLRFGRTRLPAPSAPAWWSFMLAGFAYAALTALALPPVGVWPMALVAVAPLVWAGCRGAERAKRAALLTGLGTLPLWALEHIWMMNVSAEGTPLLCLYLSLHPCLFVWAIAHARRADWPIPMALVVPAVWTALEVLRGEVIFTGYAWFLAGHPLIDAPLLAAPAALIGAYGVSFLCAALAGALADAAGWSGIPRSIGGIGALALLLIWPSLGLVGRWQLAGSGGPQRIVHIGIVQTNLPQSNKMFSTVAERLAEMQKFLELTRQAAAVRPAPDVICWPETMFLGPALNAEAADVFRTADVKYRDGGVPFDRFYDDLTRVQQDIGIPMLVGTPTRDGDVLADLNGAGRLEHSRVYNSVVLVDKGRAQPGRYDKMELMPFGEVIPYLWRWPELQQWVVDFGAKGMAFDLSPGTRAEGIAVPARAQGPDSQTPGPNGKALRIATPICFEGTRAGLCRRLVRGEGGSAGRSDLLINFSNDGWFGSWDPGRRQHLLACRWRCVELGVPMVRCVNTGVSAHIDPMGRIVNERLVEKPGNDQTEGVLAADVPIDPSHSPTLFERTGLMPAYLVMFVGIGGVLVFWWRSRGMESGA